VILIARLRAADPKVDEVLSWHWHEWGAHDEVADKTVWRARLVNRCSAAGIPFTLLALLEGEPVGCLTVCTDDADASYEEHGPWLSGMVVLGVARNMGVGRALLAGAAEHAQADGAAELWVWTTEADAFYERCGYQYVHRKAGLRDRSVLHRTL